MDCFPTSIPSKRSKRLLAYVRISSRHIIFACATTTNNQKYLRLLLDMVPLQSLLGFLENFLSSSATRPGAGQQPVVSRSNVALPVANAQKHRIHPHIMHYRLHHMHRQLLIQVFDTSAGIEGLNVQDADVQIQQKYADMMVFLFCILAGVLAWPLRG